MSSSESDGAARAAPTFRDDPDTGVIAALMRGAAVGQRLLDAELVEILARVDPASIDELVRVLERLCRDAHPD